MPQPNYNEDLETRKSIMKIFDSKNKSNELRISIKQYVNDTEIDIISNNVTFNDALNTIKCIIDKVTKNLTSDSSQELDTYNDFSCAINQFCKTRIIELKERLEK